MKASPLTNLVLHAIDDLKGLDVRVLDVRAQTPMTDTMVVCTGTSSRHVRSIAENVIREAKLGKQPPQGVEGLDSSEWVLVDLGDVIVHIMQAQTRLFYQLEKLWDMAPARASPAKKKVARAAKRKKGTKSAGRKAKKKAPAKAARRGTRKAAKKKPSRKG